MPEIVTILYCIALRIPFKCVKERYNTESADGRIDISDTISAYISSQRRCIRSVHVHDTCRIAGNCWIGATDIYVPRSPIPLCISISDIADYTNN